MRTECIDLARVGPNLANQLSSLAEEKFDRAAGVAHDEHGQAQAQHVCASDRIVLQGAFNLLILLHYLPLLIQLRLQKECLSGTCRGQQYLRALVASHCDNGCCNAHSEGTVRHELCTAALDCDGENSAIVSRQSDELLLRVLIVALRAAREPDAICDWIGSVTTHDRPARGTLNGRRYLETEQSPCAIGIENDADGQVADNREVIALNLDELRANTVRLVPVYLDCRLDRIILLIDHFRTVQVQSAAFRRVLASDERCAIFAREVAVEHAAACRSGDLSERLVVRDTITC